MDDETRRFVRDRAGDRCEYCRISQRYFAQLFQIEHVIARCHGGTSSLENLALACRRCNLHKGPNLSGIDPATGEIVPLFNPRKQDWEQHFQCADDGMIEGLTSAGRTTVRVLSMNTDRRVELRRIVRLLEG
jgi:hypothetical protein